MDSNQVAQNTFKTESEYVDYLMRRLDKLPVEFAIKQTLSEGAILASAGGVENSVYILKRGVIRNSIVTEYVDENSEGLFMNFSYVYKTGLVSLFYDDQERLVIQPYDVHIESETAEFYKIDRIYFWKLVKSDPILNNYVLSYYQSQLKEYMKMIKTYTFNGKYGMICSFLYDCTKIFGIELDGGRIEINHNISQQTIADFCGISTRSSVTRIITKLTHLGIIESKNHHFIINDLAYLKQYTFEF
ncbi:Crp/Fnr family transcriptional regulator [Weissella coleopterorum]|uniref:Crp/Fnr family transcriptional regulator n=1 Tax=Weissella coleopterorum TaxID=2714949 RepID=A0A6G8B1W3_9LACO|nr:Crp/Fnr family transcriptional regulator [Weissella coleopterorum]QIL51199.1 Crp/Fnr family transcriptional regulator [Weissella coleopterorum]